MCVSVSVSVSLSVCLFVCLSVCVPLCLCVKRASGMYEERLLQQSWRSVNHICLSADASMHANQDALLGISWSWELNQACYASIQNMVPGKTIYEHEDLLAPAISIRAAENKVERVAAYRQLQATSHMLERLVGRGLSDFSLRGVCLRATQADEVRVVVFRNGKNIAFLVNMSTRKMVQVIPDTLDNVPLLVLSLDQGAIGACSAGFFDSMNKLVLVRFEKIHRLIRDIKQPIGKICSGALLKAVMYSSYIWNLQSKPWGSGWFGTVLQRSLNIFEATTTINSPIFRKYLPRLAEEFNMPLNTEDERQAIWNRVCTLRSISCRGEQCKHGRWFSWNAAAQQNLGGFSAQKMIIEHQVCGSGSDLVDPDSNDEDFADIVAAAKKVTPSAVISKLREQGGQYWIDILAVINWELGVGLSFPVMSLVHPHSILGVGLPFLDVY